MTPDQPQSYPRRILLAVTGLSPQVVTETLYALAFKEPAFVPTEVHLLTTREGGQRARLALLSDDPGWFRRLLQDCRLPAIDFDAKHIHVLTDAAGADLDDIRTPQDNERAADLITETVRTLTGDPAAALHVSIAGGRKTMGFYLGYALSLFGREQDRLSHVLVAEPFESSWDFFYPTPYDRIIQSRDHKLANTAEARVTLAEIPFVRLRQGLPDRLLEGHASFTDAVSAANRSWAAPRLRLQVDTATAWVDGERLDLGPTEFAVLLWLAEQASGETPEVGWATRQAAQAFLDTARRVMNPAGGEYERLSAAILWRQDSPKDLADYFEPQKSRINKAIRQVLGEYAAERYAIRRTGPRGASRYYVPLAPENIEIC